MGGIDILKESMTTLSGHIYKLGHETVAKEANLSTRVVKSFCANPQGSKNSDIEKIKQAVKRLMPEEKKEDNANS